MTAPDAHRAIDAVWRIESPRLIAGLTRMVRGDFLFKLGRLPEARTEFERAASLTRNARERALLLARAAACAPEAGPPT